MASTKDFFTKMPCIVDTNRSFEGPSIADDDTIVRVEYRKSMYPWYTVYYLHRLFGDERVYKCKAQFKCLPDAVKNWISERTPMENSYLIRWEGVPGDSK